MGWKTFKTHFRVGHIVHMRDANLCIGSPYITNIFEIDPKTGRMIKGEDRDTHNADLSRYRKEIEETTPSSIIAMLQASDTFAASIPCYRIEGCEVLEKQCESFEWPSVTHDGELMYENTHFPTRRACIEYGIRNAKAGINIGTRRVADCEKELDQAKKYLDDARVELAALEQLLEKEGKD